MQAVILAAGLGTRMGQLTKTVPKALLKIQDKTILEHNLAELPDEVDEVILVVGYLGEQIRKSIGEKFLGKSIRYVSQTELKGTAHALFLCRNLLHGRFLVLMGDDLYDRKDLEKLFASDLGVLAWELRSDDLLSGYQALVKTDKDGKLVDIIERQPAEKGALVNTGAYLLNDKLFEYELVAAGQPAGEYGLPQTFLQMVRDGAIFKVVKAEFWHKIASPVDLAYENNN